MVHVLCAKKKQTNKKTDLLTFVPLDVFVYIICHFSHNNINAGAIINTMLIKVRAIASLDNRIQICRRYLHFELSGPFRNQISPISKPQTKNAHTTPLPIHRMFPSLSFWLLGTVLNIVEGSAPRGHKRN